jgi:transcription elongation factor GreA-like protein
MFKLPFLPQKILMTDVEKGAVYKPLSLRKTELRDVERCFARLFSSEEGQRVLAHLQVMTFQRVLSAESSDQDIRYLEGQRALMASILRLIDRGRNP